MVLTKWNRCASEWSHILLRLCIFHVGVLTTHITPTIHIEFNRYYHLYVFFLTSIVYKYLDLELYARLFDTTPCHVQRAFDIQRMHVFWSEMLMYNLVSLDLILMLSFSLYTSINWLSILNVIKAVNKMTKATVYWSHNGSDFKCCGLSVGFFNRVAECRWMACGLVTPLVTIVGSIRTFHRRWENLERKTVSI